MTENAYLSVFIVCNSKINSNYYFDTNFEILQNINISPKYLCEIVLSITILSIHICKFIILYQYSLFFQAQISICIYS